MSKKVRQSFTCLILCRQEIEALITAFQRDFQESEITIDGSLLLDETSLDRFDPAYKASLLLAQGLWVPVRENAYETNLFQRVELRLERKRATLRLLNKKRLDRAEAGAIDSLSHLLKLSENRAQQWFNGALTLLLLFWSVPWIVFLYQHNIPFFWLMSAEVVIVPIVLLVFGLLLHLCHLETHVYILPGREKTSSVYEWWPFMGRFLVATGVLTLCETLSFIGVHVLLR